MMMFTRVSSRELAPMLGLFLVGQPVWATAPAVASRSENHRVMKEAQKVISRHWNLAGMEIQIEILKNLDEELLSDPSVDWELQWTGQRPFSGLMSLPAVFKRQGHVIKRSLLVVKTRIFKNALVAARPIERHEAMQREAFHVEKIECVTDPDHYVSDFAALENKRATRRLGAQSALLEQQMELIPLIRKGDAITVVHRSGSMEVAVKAVAKADGHRGDVISVMNLHTGRLMMASINEGRELEVFSGGQQP